MLPGLACTDDLDCDGVPDDSDCAPRSGVAWTEAPEACDGWDNDCDGLIDEDHDTDGDGSALCTGDCDDEDPAIGPDAAEVCNGIDDNCDGLIDLPRDVQWEDGDLDQSSSYCDCDDRDPAVHPGAEEIPGNDIDEDCDGETEELCCIEGPESGCAVAGGPDELSAKARAAFALGLCVLFLSPGQRRRR